MHADKIPDKPALIFEDDVLSYGELWQKVLAVSGYFSRELGSKHQKVVDLLLTNSPQFVITYLAVLHAGHIALPLDPAYKKLELDAIIDQIPPQIIVLSPRYQDQIGPHQPKPIIVDELMAMPAVPVKPLRLAAKDQVASLTFTSGTSGRPKAVPNTHANHIWSIKACSKIWQWSQADSLLISLPLSHWYGLVMGLSGALYHGNTLYLQQQAFNPADTLELLSTGKISMFTHVPLAYMKLLNHQTSKQYDLSGVRVMISGGAALPPAIRQQFKDRFGADIIETYGSSETGRIAANSLDEQVPGSPGRILPGVDMKLSPDGEVLIKSPGVFPGYWRNQPATNQGRTPDGYWKTGDLGQLKDKFLFLKGRAQEIIRRFGYTVSPRDVEWAMYQNPAVKEVYVMGRQANGPNDELVYFIVTSLSDEQILAYCKRHLIFAWRPDKLIRLDEIPRTRTGKLRLKALQEMVT